LSSKVVEIKGVVDVICEQY